MSADSENGALARQVLDEYYRGFQERNPQLKVFSSHIHLDKATPHLHIDFVPFTTGSKRVLDTRVPLKQAFATQGFKDGTRGDTEWNRWVQAEKEQLAVVMEHYGIEWEHKGKHKKYLSVLNYKKQEREKEIMVLDDTIASKDTKRKVLADQISNFDESVERFENLSESLDTATAYRLPKPQGLMSTKSYKAKVAEPLVQKLKR